MLWEKTKNFFQKNLAISEIFLLLSSLYFYYPDTKEMESELDPPVSIEQATTCDIDTLMTALDEASKNGHLRPRNRESVLRDIGQYYKLKLWDILAGCCQLIPQKNHVGELEYIELWAVLLCLDDSPYNTREYRDALIHKMITQAQETARNQCMNLISVTDHGNLKRRFLWYWAQEVWNKYQERQAQSPDKTLFEIPLN